jgi:type II secretory pathway pseudopilin PulG
MTPHSWCRRTAWLAVLAAGLAWPLIASIERVRHEHRVRSLLLTVQRALQDYHVDQERYVPSQELPGAELIAILSDFGFLGELPVNPWTGDPWKLDGQEPDHLRYGTDPDFETYSLRALDPQTGRVLLEIDSVKQPSLE